MESWERMKQAVAGRWTGKPDKTGITVLNPSESTLIARSVTALGCASSIIARTAASELFMSWKRMVAIPST